MSTKFKTIVSVSGVIVFALAVLFYAAYKQNRSALPAILPPGQDITKLIPPSSKPAPAPTPGTNTTSMPFTLPAGFNIGIFAKNLGAPRVMIIDQSSRILVSIPSSGQVVALPDSDVNGESDSPIIVAENLRKPHGLAFHCEGSSGVQKCKLYIAEEDKVRAWDYDQSTAKASDAVKIVDLPTGGNHTSRTIEIFEYEGTPKLFVSTGSSCNVCIEKDTRRAAIWYSNLDGSDFKSFAQGLRNTVFFKQHPSTNQIWGTDMGRDLLGDNTPPEEINIIEKDKHYGWPFCYGGNVRDNTFDSKNIEPNTPGRSDMCFYQKFTGTHLTMQAHSAPLGLTFIPDDGPSGWPENMHHNLLVAQHGSWNSSVPVGYKIVRFNTDEAGNIKSDTAYIPESAPSELSTSFLSGFLQSKNAKQALGRPVDVLALPGGILYISDDKAGVIYKMTFTN